MQLREIMTAGVVTAEEDDAVRKVAGLMRERGVGSVAGGHASRPLISAGPEMDLEEAAALMVQHRVRRLPVLESGELVGIVTLDDIAVRTGNLEIAQRMTADVIEGALPEFYFHDRG